MASILSVALRFQCRALVIPDYPCLRGRQWHSSAEYPWFYQSRRCLEPSLVIHVGDVAGIRQPWDSDALQPETERSNTAGHIAGVQKLYTVNFYVTIVTVEVNRGEVLSAGSRNCCAGVVCSLVNFADSARFWSAVDGVQRQSCRTDAEQGLASTGSFVAAACRIIGKTHRFHFWLLVRIATAPAAARPTAGQVLAQHMIFPLQIRLRLRGGFQLRACGRHR